MLLRPLSWTFSGFVLIVIAGCVSQASKPEKASHDSSPASALYESEALFLDRQGAGDAFGMARAAKLRLGLVERLDSSAPRQNSDRVDPRSDQRRSSLLASVREMLAAANDAAADDEDTLRRIERLFPVTQTAQSEGLKGFSGIIGGLREVKMTIGLEFEASLVPAERDTIRLPVDGETGTTIYAQPLGHQLIESTAKISMDVSRLIRKQENWESVSCPATTAARLPCFIPAGDHSEIEISLQNNGTNRVDILVFISGNAETVSASMAQHESNQPNRLGDE